MKTTVKTIFSLSLVIVFLFLCISVLTVGYAGIWLHTYNVFTQRDKVADIELSELKSDSVGEYVDLKIREYDEPSALEKLFNVGTSKTVDTQFKVYGDAIYIGGPMIKFKDELILLNFKTVYKLSKVYGRYIDNTKEINKPVEAQRQSSYDLNGGYGDWKVMFDNYRADNLLGKFYQTVIDTTQLSEPGQIASNRPLKYELYITNNGFMWDLVENQ